MSTFATAVSIYLEKADRSPLAENRALKLCDALANATPENVISLLRQHEASAHPGCKKSSINTAVRQPYNAIANAAGSQWPKIALHRVQRKSLPSGTQFSLPRILSEIPRDDIVWLAPMACFLLMTGARMREMICLDWSDVDLDGATAVFRRTKRGREQAVVLPDSLVAMLRSLSHRHGAVFRMKNKEPHPDYKRIVSRGLPPPLGGARIPALTALLSKHGITPHDLRHVYVSLIARSHGLHAARDCARHSSIRTTERYAHLELSHVRGLVREVFSENQSHR
ncbi:MAG: tyrosine-type recombinase/integrase [Epibacterium sp.]|nr:tyrosine-type recombinase/integrase [Epibacterium sp.]NQX73759.1 tyrosine-type recombinase/integrase [Epibacterium sp.]